MMNTNSLAPEAMPTLSIEDQQRLDDLLTQSLVLNDNYMGYPAAKDFNYEFLTPFLNFQLNNIGDPFVTGTWRGDTKQFEQEVMAFFAELYHAPKDNWWGYVTNGGTEGNLYALYLARELYPDGTVYFSQDSHYSVNKNLQFLNMRNNMIRSLPNGEIDYEDLRETLKVNTDSTPIIFANIGSTMTEARDDIKKIKNIMIELGIERYYIHSDAALSGMILPFVDNPSPFDFADGADSITLSGHKFLGSPIPCGIVITKKDMVDRIARSVAYIGNLDTTVTGSRNALSPLILWYRIRSLGLEGIQRRVNSALAMTERVLDKLKAAGIEAWRNPNTITIVMPRPSDTLVNRWQIASTESFSHLILVNGINEAKVNQFIEEFAAERQRKEEAS